MPFPHQSTNVLPQGMTFENKTTTPNSASFVISSSSSDSSKHVLEDNTVPPSRFGSPPSQIDSQSTNDSSWDSSTFSSGAYLLPAERNGDWRTETTNAFKNPYDAVSALQEKLRWLYLREKAAEFAEKTSEQLQLRVNHVFDGKDVPEMHNKVMDLVPSISLPSMRQVSQSMDSLTDKAQNLVRRRQSVMFLNQELVGDRLLFARHLGKKARRALVAQGICKEWQVMPSRATLDWQAELDAALTQVFNSEKSSFSVQQLFSMDPVWRPDAESSVWHLELDTKMEEVIVEPGTEIFEQKPILLRVPLGLPESYGCLAIADVERDAKDTGDWLEVE